MPSIQRIPCDTTKPIEDFDVLEFRNFSTDDPFDAKWGAWSRAYEYEWVLLTLKKLGANSKSTVHNTSWGFEGGPYTCHREFKEALDGAGYETLHSDIIPSTLPRTTLWNLTEDPPSDWVQGFDFVINISTMEEVNANHVQILRRLFSMVKEGGYLLCTFDLPGLQLPSIEEEVEENYFTNVKEKLTGDNSVFPEPRFSYLTAGKLLIQR